MNTELEYQEVAEAIKNQSIELNSFQEADISTLEVPIICLYIKPSDYPKKAVARVFDMEDPINVILVRDTIEELRVDIIKSFPWMVRFERAKNDVRCIAESWM